MRIWDAETKQALHVLGGHTKQVTWVAISPNSAQVASTSGDRTIRLWSSKTGQCERVISLGASAAASIVYSHDGTELFAACDDGWVRAFSVGSAPEEQLQSLERLFEAVWSAPDDDGPRAVLADFLSERGDPRGEFISLQLRRAAGKSSSEAMLRERELLERHQHEWVGALAPLIKPTFVKFERGFVVSCALKAVVEKGTPARHRAWATVKRFMADEKSPKRLVKYLERLGATRVA